MRDVPCLEASQTLHAPVIAPAGAAAVQQKALAAQAAAVAGMRYGNDSPENGPHLAFMCITTARAEWH
jgi:hypothetical protein